jgi:DNA-binding NarL/FixJ family response regulator
MVSTKNTPARLVIVDDHDLVRAGLKAMLSLEEGLDIVGEAANGREAVELCRRVRTDLVLMDVRMPEMDGLAATREIKRHSNDVSVLMLSSYESEDYLLEAIRVGAAGYTLKDAPADQLVTAIRRVLEGEVTLSRRLTTKLLRRLATEAPEPPPEPPVERRSEARPLEPLTVRELEVLRLLALGHSNRQIAEELVISLGTAKNHVEHIRVKLGASDRTQAVVQALKLGLIELPGR